MGVGGTGVSVGVGGGDVGEAVGGTGVSAAGTAGSVGDMDVPVDGMGVADWVKSGDEAGAGVLLDTASRIWTRAVASSPELGLQVGKKAANKMATTKVEAAGGQDFISVHAPFSSVLPTLNRPD